MNKKVKKAKKVRMNVNILITAIILAVLLTLGCATVKKNAVVSENTVPNQVSQVSNDTPEMYSMNELQKYEWRNYNVKKGDCLWDIAGQKRVYGDPFMWVLLFKANRDQIENPELIEVGQRLQIERLYSKNEMETSIQQAKDYEPRSK